MGGVYRRPPMGARTTLTDAWPLFGLRLRTRTARPAPADRRRPARLCSRSPRPASIRPTRCRSGWPGRRSRARRSSAASCSTTGRTRATWSPDELDLNLMVEFGRRADRLAVDRRRARSPSTGRSTPGSWLGRAFQGRGFGKEMRAAVLGFAFDGLGARVAETSAFLDNAAVERGLALARLRGERVRQPGAGGRRAGHPAVPDDRRGLAVAAAAAARRSRARGVPGAVRGLNRGRPARTRRRPRRRRRRPPPPNPPPPPPPPTTRGVADGPERRHHPADVRDRPSPRTCSPPPPAGAAQRTASRSRSGTRSGSRGPRRGRGPA